MPPVGSVQLCQKAYRLCQNGPDMDDATEPEPQPAPEPEPESARHPSRRWFLAFGGALVVGGGAGTGIAFLRPVSKPKPTPPPRPPAHLGAALDAAIAAEQDLLADLTATTGGAKDVRLVIAQARADHTAHLRALRGVLASLPEPAHHRRLVPPPGRPRTQAQLRTAEARAAHVAAARAGRLDGSLAALLASIAACEATHAELLT